MPDPIDWIILGPMEVVRVLGELVTALEREGIDYALIGALAMAPHNAGRATKDVDLLVDADRADDVDRLMRGMGYDALHRTVDVGNFLSDDPRQGRVDFLFAHRPRARAMLGRARAYRALPERDVRAVDAEDLIGLKVQASSNDRSRMRLDVADIVRLLRARPDLDMERVRGYFALFDREDELAELLAEQSEDDGD